MDARARLIAALADVMSRCELEMARDIVRRLAKTGFDGPARFRDLAPMRVTGCRALPPLTAALPDLPLQRAFHEASDRLPWEETPRESCLGSYRDNHAFVELAGPAGLLPAEGFRFGLLLLAPEIFYPSHAHNAEELFLIVSGSGAWQLDDGPFSRLDPGDHVHIQPNQPHATMTSPDVGVLTIWAWRGRIDRESYRFL